MMDPTAFDISMFADMLGFRPWPYSPDTYTNGTGRFVDWSKGEQLLGIPHSELFFSAYDEAQRRNVLWGFPAPKTMHDAVETAASVGWHTHGAAVCSTNLMEAARSTEGPRIKKS
jgi:hypothetical protein